MATILASWELGRGYGHLAALVPAARALKALGHRVVLAAKDPETALRAPGQPFDLIVPAPQATAPTPESTLTFGAVIRDAGFDTPIQAERLTRQWLTLLAEHKADAVLAEHAPISLLAAHVAGLPAARLGIGFTVPPALRPFPSLQPWKTEDDAALLASDAQADTVVRAVCAATHAPPVNGIAELLANVPPFLATWPELDVYGPRAGATYYGSMGGYGGAGRPLWPGGIGPKVFVYLSVGHRLASELAQALATLRWPTIWHSAAAPAKLPPTIRYSAQPVDIGYVLKRADIQVGRAGHASLCDGLALGKPQLMLPDTLETLLLAGKLATQNLGLFAWEDMDVEGLVRLLRETAQNESHATAAKAFRDRYARYRPEQAAAELARDLLKAWGR